MKLLLAGYYGSGNLGDEAILHALINGIRSIYPKAYIEVLSANHIEHNYPGTTSIPKFKLLPLLRSIRKCDAFILGGGGLLQDVTSRQSLYYYSALMIIAKFFKKKVILLGHGIGPVKHKFILRHALKNVDLVTVRDEHSLNELVGLKVHINRVALTADLAFMTDAPNTKKANLLFDLEGIAVCKSKIIGVSLRPFIKDLDADRKHQDIASLCDWLIDEKDCQIVFLVFKKPDDLDLANKIISLMKNQAHIMLKDYMQDEMVSILSQFDAVIGMRLHSLIFSARADVPAFGLSYDPKVENFQKIMELPWMDVKELTFKTLKERIGHFMDNPPRFELKVHHLIDQSKLNLKYFAEAMENKKVSVLGIEIDNVNLDEALIRVYDIFEKRIPSLIVTPNPEIIIASEKDVELRKIINTAALAPVDGVGLMMAGRILGRKFKQRIPGIDLMGNVIKLSKVKGYKMFLFGGREGVVEAAAEKIGSNVVGTYHGYSKNDRDVIDAIKKAKPDILFVGLGSPRQEKWAARHLRELEVPLVMCIGGSLDVISGKVKRAPFIMRKLGFEWLYRLIREPYRWKRMLNLPLFIVKVIASRI